MTGAEQQLAALALLALIGAAVLSWRIGRGVTLPMAGLAETARRLASGDVVQSGHGLGLHVTAEGVEHSEVLALLRRVGCDLAQGWLIARPMPVPAALQWLERQGIGDASVHAVVARPALAEH